MVPMKIFISEQTKESRKENIQARRTIRLKCEAMCVRRSRRMSVKAQGGGQGREIYGKGLFPIPRNANAPHKKK